MKQQQQLDEPRRQRRQQQERRREKQQRRRRQQQGLQPRVIGGRDVTDELRYPYFSLMWDREMCGGSLIGPDLVVTAAHCVDAADTIRIGRYNRFNDDMSIEYTIVQKLVHPLFVVGMYPYDIMLLRIALQRETNIYNNTISKFPYIRLPGIVVPQTTTPTTTTPTITTTTTVIEENDNINDDDGITIDNSTLTMTNSTTFLNQNNSFSSNSSSTQSLPISPTSSPTATVTATTRSTSSSIRAASDSNKLVVLGMGDAISGSSVVYPTYLQEVSVYYVPNEQCRSAYVESQNNITSDMLCASGPGRDACIGDSGGPLIIKGDNADQDELVGIVSWGIRCADERYPGVYSRISQFTDWIVQTSCIVSQNPPEYFDCSHRPQVEDTTNLYVEFSITPTIAPKFAPTMHPTTANNNMPVSSPSSPHDGSLPPSAPTVASSSSPPLSNGFGGPTFATISLLLTMIAMTFGGPTRT